MKPWITTSEPAWKILGAVIAAVSRLPQYAVDTERILSLGEQKGRGTAAKRAGLLWCLAAKDWTCMPLRVPDHLPQRGFGGNSLGKMRGHDNDGSHAELVPRASPPAGLCH